MRHELTEKQAVLLRAINQRAVAALNEWRVALTLAGVNPDDVVESQLGDDPHLVLKDDTLSA